MPHSRFIEFVEDEKLKEVETSIQKAVQKKFPMVREIKLFRTSEGHVAFSILGNQPEEQRKRITVIIREILEIRVES